MRGRGKGMELFHFWSLENFTVKDILETNGRKGKYKYQLKGIGRLVIFGIGELYGKTLLSLTLSNLVE